MIKLFDECGKAILQGGLYYKVVKTDLTKTFYHKQKLFSKKTVSYSSFFLRRMSIKKKRYIFNCLTCK